MDWFQVVIVIFVSFACVAAGMPLLISYLQKRAILDHPNHRSSHTTPTLKGAGLVVIPVIAGIWIVFSQTSSISNTIEVLVISVMAILITIVSWLDDLHHLSAKVRLSIHIMATTLAVYWMPGDILFFQGIFPPFLDQGLAIISWVWFINLFNFMDGIDGISGVEAIIIALGVIVIAGIHDSAASMAPYAGVILGAATAFLIWNWQPAKIFLGDAGSAPLGFVLGWLLLSLVAQGQWQAALIIPGYYLADATITLAFRIFRRERIWQAHNKHFYQQAVIAGKSHASIVLMILGEGIFLIGSAYLAAIGQEVVGITLAVITILALLIYFHSQRPEN